MLPSELFNGSLTTEELMTVNGRWSTRQCTQGIIGHVSCAAHVLLGGGNVWGICVEKSWPLQECWWLQSDCFGHVISTN